MQKLTAMEQRYQSGCLTTLERDKLLHQLSQRSIDAEVSAAHCMCASCSTVTATSILAQTMCVGSITGLACISTCGLGFAYCCYQCAQGSKEEAFIAKKGLMGYKKYLENQSVLHQQGYPLAQTMNYTGVPSARVINQ